MTFIGFVYGAAAVIALLILIGGSLTLIRGSYSKARIQALREDNEDLRARLNDCDQKISDGEQREELLDQRISHLESENSTLKSMVTQRANVNEVIELLTEHHQQATEYWERVLTFLETMKEDGA